MPWAAFADEIGADRIHLAGISLGGMIAQYAAVAHRDRIATLTLLSTSPCFGLDGTAPEVWRAARLASLDAGREPADFADAVLAGIAGPNISPDALAGQQAAMARISSAALRRSIECLVTHDSRAVLGSVAVPTLCLVGEPRRRDAGRLYGSTGRADPGGEGGGAHGSGPSAQRRSASGSERPDRRPPRASGAGMTEWRYIEAFAAQFTRCALRPDEVVAILSETQSRSVLVETARLAAQSLGAAVFDVVVPTPASSHPVPIRSTGASQAIAGNRSVIAALAAADLVIDCTVEGLLHAPELGQILNGGARVLMVSNEHPDTFDRLAWDPDLPRRVELGLTWMRAAATMAVTSAAGTDLTVRLGDAVTAGSTGVTAGPGSIAHWPGGLVLAFPAAGAVEGKIVLAPGDINLTFNRYFERSVTLTIEDDHIVDISGDGVDAALFRSYLAAFEDRESYATSHLGWGMNPFARWDYLELYDKRDVWGTEARAFAGNFLYSTGANEHAGRFTAGHFDLPMRGCTVRLDDRVVVEGGELVADLRA